MIVFAKKESTEEQCSSSWPEKDTETWPRGSTFFKYPLVDIFKSAVLVIKLLILSQYVSLRASPDRARHTRGRSGAAGTRSKERAACGDRAPNDPNSSRGCQITPLIIPGHPIVNNPNDNKSNIQEQYARCSELTKVGKHEGMVVLHCIINSL